MGDDEAALLRLWREKRGEVEPEDLSGNLLVQLGAVTEDLNRLWYQANTGEVVADVQRHVKAPGSQLDGGYLRRPRGIERRRIRGQIHAAVVFFGGGSRRPMKLHGGGKLGLIRHSQRACCGSKVTRQ